MATQVQWRRGTSAQHATFVGAPAEVTVDTTDWSLRVHDGVTAGGRLVRASRVARGPASARPVTAEPGDIYVSTDTQRLSVYL